MAESNALLVRRLGRAAYESVWRRMSAFTAERDASTGDEFWLVEHPPVYTLGQAGKPEHVLNPGAIPVIHSDRGGQVTYHGPGQLVAYPLVNLQRRGIGVRELVARIETTLIRTLADYRIEAQRRAGAPGVYVKDAKIAALGLRVRRGCSFHGMSLNVNADLEAFTRINPCGYPGLAVINMADLLDAAPALDAVGRRLVEHFAAIMEYEAVTAV